MARIDACLRGARAMVGPGEAELLLAHVLDRSRSWLYSHGDEALDEAAAQRFAGLLERRRAGEQVSPATLIPRPETELLVEQALARIPEDRPTRIADLGTGSGAIALALALERPLAQVTGTDASESALAVARANATSLGLVNVDFRCGDWLAPLGEERCDLIASNPPYIAEGDVHLASGDLRFEPRSALASGVDGLDDIRTIVAGAPALLRAGGWLLLEHGLEQGAAVRALLSAAGLRDVATVRDLEQRDRVSFGRLA